MPILQDILDDHKRISKKISDQARAAAIGFISISLSLLSSQGKSWNTFLDKSGKCLVCCSFAFSILALVFDFIQYGAVLTKTDTAAKNAESTMTQDVGYNPDSFASVLQVVMFLLKLLSVFVAFVLMVSVFVRNCSWR